MSGYETSMITLNDGGKPIERIMGGNGRLSIFRAKGGTLMCRSQAGLLCSEVPVKASLCGADHGCDGRWLCLTRFTEVLIDPSESAPIFKSKV